MNKAIRRFKWYDFLWIWSIVYFALGFFNIMFAWLGMIDFLVPIVIAAVKGDKFFCNKLCGRGQLLHHIGTTCKCSRNKPTPRWMVSKWFRYGFLIFFLAMFGVMVFQTWMVASGAASLKEAVRLLWAFDVPWGWTYRGGVLPDWVAQFAFGFYSIMLTSTLIGLVVTVLFKPRSWCVFCPMGTMTQLICRLRNRSALKRAEASDGAEAVPEGAKDAVTGSGTEASSDQDAILPIRQESAEQS